MYTHLNENQEISIEWLGNLKNKNIVLFIPGYKGSELIDSKEHEISWLTARESIWGSTPLTLSHIEYGICAPKEYFSGNVFTTLRVLPYVLELDIYNRGLQNIKNALPKEYQLVTLPYDWRRSLIHTSKDIVARVHQVIEAKPKSLHIITHSMGGLLTAYILQHPKYQKVVSQLASVSFVGTPFGGVISVLEDLGTISDPIGFNSRILSTEAFSTFPSVYQLLPPTSPEFKQNFDASLIYEPSIWEKLNWGAIKYSNRHKTTLENSIRFTRDMLQEAKDAHDIIHSAHNTVKLNAKIIAIRGTGILTRSGAELSYSNFVFPKAKKEPWFIHGDGVVNLKSSALPDSLGKRADTFKEHILHLEHSKMLTQESTEIIATHIINSTRQLREE